MSVSVSPLSECQTVFYFTLMSQPLLEIPKDRIIPERWQRQGHRNLQYRIQPSPSAFRGWLGAVLYSEGLSLTSLLF